MKNKLSSNLLFATQIYHEKLLTAQVNKNSILKDIKLECYQIQRMDIEGLKWSEKNYRNGYTSYSSQDQIHQLSSTFHDLEKKISKHVGKFLQRLDYNATANDLKMTDFWVNIMGQNAIHTAHIHPNSVISGTFYVSKPKKSSGIQFQDPRLAQLMNSPALKPDAKTYNQRFVTVFPVAGDIVLFESWLLHEVPLNITKDPRISVSFNYDWK